MLTVNKKYLFLTALLFIVETLIAMYVHDNFIRPYLGDVLVVILIYCFVKSFLKVPVLPAAFGVLLFSCFIELMQYFNFVTVVGLEKHKIAKIVLGSSFEWLDIVAYVVGFVLLLLFDKPLLHFKEISEKTVWCYIFFAVFLMFAQICQNNSILLWPYNYFILNNT